MAWTAHPIEHHASDGQAWIVVPEAAHQGGQGPGLPARLHHQDDGQLQQRSHMGRAPLGRGAFAIEEAHHPLHQAEIGLGAMALERLLQPGPSAEQGVEVAAGPATGEREQLRVEIVRPHLEGLQAQAAAAGQGRKGQAHQGLAAAAGRSGNQAGHGGS